jgi:hypothetical protein
VLDRELRGAILQLHGRGRGTRRIARELKISRSTVRKVVESGDPERPEFQRDLHLDPHVERVRELFDRCEGNLVRVHEELAAEGVEAAYPTLTAFCRRYGIGVEEKRPAGRYTFGPGQEMQHDTSPHDVPFVAGRRRMQCASLVLAYSRMQYAQLYPTFDRFYAKAFLTEALQYLDGAAGDCMVDNTNVVVAYGTGKNAVMAPEMVAFGERFGFTFIAHELGDANRKARVERPFDHIENNFYKGRTFADLGDANRQLRGWCDKVGRKRKRSLKAAPIELYAAEKPHLHRLPDWVPEVVRVLTRRVGVEANVTLHTNAYPVPADLIDQQVEVHEALTAIRILHRHRVVAEYAPREPGREERVPRPPEMRGRRRAPPAQPSPEEAVLIAAGTEFATMVALLRRHHHGGARVPIRRLHRLYLDYETERLRAALATAAAHGLYDLARIERMVLRGVAADLFRLPVPGDDEEE